MNFIHIIEQGRVPLGNAKWRVTVSWQQDKAAPVQYLGQLEVADPMTDDDHAELRWYSESCWGEPSYR